MFSRTLIAAIAVFVLSSSLTANATSRTVLTRQEIRSIPIVERPSRPGHFYGNTVRRNVTRRGG